MLYQSTRGGSEKVTASQAIKTGMVPSGGLFVPERIPSLDYEEMRGLTYAESAARIFQLFLTDFSDQEIKEICQKVYNEDIFASKDIVPLAKINDSLSIMELWHGPTAAFKDVALQMLPHLMQKSLEKLGYDKKLLILAATSGDTGKAALEGFKDIEGIKIICLYPHQKVSKVQELQMTTTEGHNTYVIAVEGNFDDCQRKVKEIFANEAYKEDLLALNTELSSANSINWGRLLPQIVYYYKSYVNLLEEGQIEPGQLIDFVVPTGNFGNILAAWYAKKMGLPIRKLICASNINNILTDFINTGKYDTHRDFIETTSPSMDILVSSNLERFLYEISGRDEKFIAGIMQDLQERAAFQIDSKLLSLIQEELLADYADETETAETIKKYFDDYKYLLDTHTAVGVRVYEKLRKAKKDEDFYTVIDATANPYKFNRSVYAALKDKEDISGMDEFEILQTLSDYSGQAIHPALKDLDKKEVRHKMVAQVNQIEEIIKNIAKD